MRYAKKVFDTGQEGSAKEGEDERNLSPALFVCIFV